jgi:translation elongation factor EF-1alpha
MTVEYTACEMVKQFQELGLTQEQAIQASLMSVSNSIVLINDLDDDNIRDKRKEDYVGYGNMMAYLFELREEILKI